MFEYFWVCLGGALGTGGRYWLSSFVGQRFGPFAQTFPLGTMVINITGSFVIGFFATLTQPDGRWLVNPVFRQFFMVGICGGYTTFSSFSLQTLNLAQEGDWLWAGVNIVASVALCLFGVWLGHVLALNINKL